QYNGPGNLALRWSYYELAEDNVNFVQEVFSRIPTGGSETILDIGCSTGENLIFFQESRQHSGQLIGVDTSSSLHITAKQPDLLKHPAIHYLRADGQNLPVVDNSA